MNKIICSTKSTERIKKKCCVEDCKRATLDGYNPAVCEVCDKDYLRYYSAKSKTCCSCREEKRLLKYGAAIIVQESYPKKEGVFSSYDDIQNYFSGDEITCLLCGNGFVSLAKHLSAIHRMTSDEYKVKFDLPLSRGLVTDKFHKSRSEECIDRGIGRDKEGMNAMRLKNNSNPHREMNKILKGHANDMLGKAVSNSQNHVTKKQNLVNCICSLCGEVLDRKITEHALLVQGCNVLCSKCQRIKYLESQKKYRNKK